MFDAACERIRDVAQASDLPLPDALRPDAVPHAKMYHVNMSGQRGGWGRRGGGAVLLGAGAGLVVGWWRQGTGVWCPDLSGSPAAPTP
jgi:ferric-dicitrate binding protein FerR (iron transport regulator)